MGGIIAKFRKKKNTFEILTDLDNEIQSIEEFQTRTRQTKRKIVFGLLFFTILLCIAFAGLVYVYHSEISANLHLWWCIPVLAFPILIWFIKITLTWWYNRKLKKNEKKLAILKKERSKILDNVCETETFKETKKILEKFGHELKKPLLSFQKNTPLVQSVARYPLESVVRQRNLQTLSKERLSFGTPTTQLNTRMQIGLATPRGTRSVLQSPASTLALPAPTPSLRRGILPRDRSVLDKMVEYLVGDGPSNRYALICSNCNSHNGMALKEEFEYLAFNCCYCNAFNPARKQRPAGPKFDSLAVTPAIKMTAEHSSSDLDSSDSESIVEEPRSDSPNTAKTSDFERLSDSELVSDQETKMEVDDATPTQIAAAEVTETGAENS